MSQDKIPVKCKKCEHSSSIPNPPFSIFYYCYAYEGDCSNKEVWQYCNYIEESESEQIE
jgi:hypothetical protein